MSQYRISAEARSDLDEIWDYITADNSEAADRLLRLLVSKIRTLASVPEMGRKRDELSPGLRSFAVGNYVIIYRRNQDGIEIVRVLHGARDFPPLFE